MLFNSFDFLILFLPVTWGIARVLRGNALLFWLAFASFVFYAFAGHWWFLVPMAISSTLDFWTGLRIEKTANQREKRFYLLLSLVANLSLLCYFKYSVLISGGVIQLLALLKIDAGTSLHHLFSTVILPAGISFYTFQTISYVIDIYRGESHAEKNFLKYVSFVAFFPHLVAGPLTRHNQLIPQLSAISEGGIRPRWRAGIYLFVLGLAKKVLIADRVANGIDPVIADIYHAGFFASWFAIVGYAVQIYFDFSGYSDMAIGLGRLFGIELPQNFDSPYQSKNPSDFWRRWHITLSQWLRDYLYISLGGNKEGPRKTERNLMITMILGGLWHGANWTFAAWGLFHGLLLVIYRRNQERWDALPLFAQKALMFFLVCMGWVFFRAPDFSSALAWFSGLVGLHDGVGPRFEKVMGLYVLASVGIAMLARNLYERDLERLSLVKEAALGALAALAILLMNYSSKFLYFQF